VVGKNWGLLTLFLDIAKGFTAVYLASVLIGPPLALVIAGLMAIIGHSKSVFIKLRGGKSAAVGMGVVLFLNWQVFLFIALLVIIVRQITGYQSVATIVGVLLMPVVLYLYQDPYEYVILTLVAGVWVLVKHIPNIKRLLAGTEMKITKKKGNK